MNEIKWLNRTSMSLDDLKVYNLAMSIGEQVWEMVAGWDYFQKDTIGKQLVRSADSIASNISEGFGRFHFKDSKNFGYYSRGSLYETKTWITKAFDRNMITKEQFTKSANDLEILAKMLNKYIKSIGQTTGTVNEPLQPYANINPFTNPEFPSDLNDLLPITTD